MLFVCTLMCAERSPQCDENFLMEHACDQTYLMVYSLVHDLGFHLRGPCLWIVLEL